MLIFKLKFVYYFSRACLDPVSVEPYEWDPNDITKWPVSGIFQPRLVMSPAPMTRVRLQA